MLLRVCLVHCTIGTLCDFLHWSLCFGFYCREGGTPLYWLYRYVRPRRILGFSAVLVIIRVLILDDFGHKINRVWFLHSSLDIIYF